MTIHFVRLGVLLLGIATTAAQAPLSDTAKKNDSRPEPVPVTHRFSADIDTAIDPCVDFYQYACGPWMKKNPVPPDYPVWAGYTEIYDYNLRVLHDILEKAARNDPARDAVHRKIGDFYASCVDDETINRLGAKAIEPELNRIAAIPDKIKMIEFMAREKSAGVGVPFSLSAVADPHDAGMTIANADQGSLPLPDRDYYLRDDARTAEIRKSYAEYLKALYVLAGRSPEQADHDVTAAVALETELAKASMDRAARRDPKNLDHRIEVAAFLAANPNLHLELYFRAAGLPEFKTLNVAAPDFFRALNGLIESVPLDAWKAYMALNLLNNSSGRLSDPFVQTNFKAQQKLTGQKELPPRWKRCVETTDRLLGDALGQAYVEETFGADGKQRMLMMVDALENALKTDIAGLSWMTEETKKQALVKLAATRNKIGYPAQWRDYSKLEISRTDLFGNFQRAIDFENRRKLRQIGSPIDRNEWNITPPTVNAYYNGPFNEIVFPAGILQPPFFDKTLDDAVNFGSIGAAIGHELTHGFDDQGRKYDAKGNLTDWWTQKDNDEFVKRADCFVEEYSGFTAVDDIKLNGRLTLGENTADNGGIRIALMAMHDLMTQMHPDAARKIDGFTPDQRFFLSAARVFCQNNSDEYARMRAKTDTHSPGRWRVNGTVQNMPEFQKAFGCKAGQPMVRENACRVW